VYPREISFFFYRHVIDTSILSKWLSENPPKWHQMTWEICY